MTDAGWNSRAAALGAPSAVLDSDPNGVASNPAFLSLERNLKQRLRLGYSLVLQQTSYDEIGSVVTSNATIGDQVRTGAPALDPPVVFGQSFGMTYTFSELSYKPSFGISAYAPLQRIAYFESGDGYQPQYVYFQERKQLPELQIGGALKLSDELAAGLGFQMGFSSTTNANVFLQNGTNKSSTLNVTTSFKPKLAPFFGLAWRPSKPASYGLVLRAPLRQEQQIFIQSSARVIGNTSTLDFTVPASGSLGYTPTTLSLGHSYDLEDKAKIFLQLDYQAWSQYQSSTLSLDQATIDQCVGGCGIQFSPTLIPASDYRDIVVPRLGGELKNDRWAVRGSYVYRPSIVATLPTGSGNALDTDEHRMAAGFGYKGFLSFDAHVSLSYLARKEVTKSNPTDIGAPGYFVGGYVWATGLSLTYEL